jgi:hypothetical protein
MGNELPVVTEIREGLVSGAVASVEEAFHMLVQDLTEDIKGRIFSGEYTTEEQICDAITIGAYDRVSFLPEASQMSSWTFVIQLVDNDMLEGMLSDSARYNVG